MIIVTEVVTPKIDEQYFLLSKKITLSEMLSLTSLTLTKFNINQYYKDHFY